MEKIKKVFTFLAIFVCLIVISILAISFFNNFSNSKEKFSSTYFWDKIYYKSNRSKCFDCEKESKRSHPSSCYDCEKQNSLTRYNTPGRVLIRQ